MRNMGRAMVDLPSKSFREGPETDHTRHRRHVRCGSWRQAVRLFNAHYDEYGFQPIVVFDGEGRFITTVLRPAKRPGGKEIRAFLRRLLRAIRANWPNTEILVRGDSHYCCSEVLDWCRANGLDYILGVAPTTTLRRHIEGLEASTKARFEAAPKNGKLRRFKEFFDGAKSWSRVERIIARVEVGAGALPPPHRHLSLSRLADRPGPRLPANHFAARPDLRGCRTLFTIHNIGYQGFSGRTGLAGSTLDPPSTVPTAWSFSAGQLSQGGHPFSDAMNTVSPTYAREIQTLEFGFGLDGCLRDRAGVLTGILNGVDYARMEPAHRPQHTGPLLRLRSERQTECKRLLLEEFALPPEAVDRPLLGIVSRLTRQKGADLLVEIAARIVAGDVYLVALGTGRSGIRGFLRHMQQEYPGRIGPHRLRQPPGPPHRGRRGHLPHAQPL